MNLTEREKINIQVSEMKVQRTVFESNWMEIADYLLPYKLRMNLSDNGRGDRRNTKIFDSTGCKAIETLGAGFMLAVTSPGSAWARLEAEGIDAVEYGPEKIWLDSTNRKMMKVFDGSNVYGTLNEFYVNFAGFGTAAMSIEETLDGKVIHSRVYPTGSYWIAQNEYGVVDTFYREFRMTVWQLWKKFGPEGDYSQAVKSMMDNGQWQEWIDVGHMVSPNVAYDPRSKARGRKQFSSCWYEIGMSSYSGAQMAYAAQVENKFLFKSGFDKFPFLVARWNLVEGEVWGIDCPGMTALGDLKSLQIGERRSWQFIEKGYNPHFVGPTALKTQGSKGYLPGDTTWIDETQGGASLRPLHDINPGWVSPLEQKLTETRRRIYQDLFYDLFRAFDFIDPAKDITATEIMERKNEKLAQLVPMLGQLSRSTLKPLIDMTFDIMWKQGMLDEPPSSLAGKNLSVEFIGVLAQAQRASVASPVEQLIGMMLPFAQLDPNAVPLFDKIDFDQAIDEIAHAKGVAATVVRSDEQVAAIREGRAQAMQNAQQMQAIEQGAKAAKDLAQAPMEGDNALTRLVGAAQ